jgi:hypothetical protein
VSKGITPTVPIDDRRPALSRRWWWSPSQAPSLQRCSALGGRQLPYIINQGLGGDRRDAGALIGATTVSMAIGSLGIPATRKWLFHKAEVD